MLSDVNLSEVESRLAEIDGQVAELASRIRSLYAALVPEARPICEQCGESFEPAEVRKGEPVAHACCGVRCGREWLDARQGPVDSLT